ncbi:MAG: cbb3-type cytochrome c oxidase subunit I, partial [Desulfobacterales bacterium]|nr:cbb3-type cytochrome c oxidase subunit I [Desulfobacterales bacterium]
MESAASFFESPNPSRFKGVLSWLITMDHKRIGLMYLFAILFWFCLAAVLGGLIRLELMFPGENLMNADVYNSAFTLHGVIMIFLFIIPALPASLGNFFLPIQIGTDDVFFPRFNLLSWYLYMLGGLIAIVSLFSDGFPDTGWTFYVP